MAAVVASCATYDQRMATDFAPTANGGWTYRTFADLANPLDSASGEAYRMQMLDIWVRENNICPTGYKADNRRSIKRGGAVHDVYYDVTCT